MTCPPRVNDLTYFSLEPDRFDRKTFDTLSQGFRDMIMKSPEWAALNGATKPANGGVNPKHVDALDDDIPF